MLCSLTPQIYISALIVPKFKYHHYSRLFLYTITLFHFFGLFSHTLIREAQGEKMHNLMSFSPGYAAISALFSNFSELGIRSCATFSVQFPDSYLEAEVTFPCFPLKRDLKAYCPTNRWGNVFFTFFSFWNVRKIAKWVIIFWEKKMKSSASIFQSREKKSFKVRMLRFTAEAAVLFGCKCFFTTEKHLDISLHLCKKKYKYIASVVCFPPYFSLLYWCDDTGKVKGRMENKKNKSYQRNSFVVVNQSTKSDHAV